MKSYFSQSAAWGLVLLLVACGQPQQETTPIRKHITETVFASGTLEADGSYELTAQTDGYLQKVLFAENDVISQGQLLAVIQNEQNQLNAQSAHTLYELAKSELSPNAPQLAQALNSAEMAKQKMMQDSVTAYRYQALANANALAKIDYEKAWIAFQNAKTELKNTLQQYEYLRAQAKQQLVINESQSNVNRSLWAYNQLSAIKAGKVYKKLKQEGDFVRRGEAIALIGNPALLYAQVSVDERSINKVKIGQNAAVRLNIDTEKTYQAKVAEILPTFDEATQSFIVKIHFAEPLGFGIARTQLQANIIVGEQKNALLIPRKFLSYSGEVMLKGATAPSKVTTKIVSSEWVQVVAGLNANSVIVTDKP